MANRRRVLRLQQLILETAANHIQRELDDPRIGLVSVTRVKLSPDLSQCILFWSVLGGDSSTRTSERGLEHALPSIQRAVAKAMATRVTPKLQLRHDEGLAHAQRLEEIFTHLREERGDEEEQDGEAASEAAPGAGDEAPTAGEDEDSPA